MAALLLYHPSSSATTVPTTVASSGQVITIQPQNSSAITAAPTTAQQTVANQSANATAEYAYILSMQIYTNVYDGNWTAATNETNTIGGLLANVSSSQLPSGLVQGFANLKQDVLNKNQAGVFNLLNIMANATAGTTTQSPHRKSRRVSRSASRINTCTSSPCRSTTTCSRETGPKRQVR